MYDPILLSKQKNCISVIFQAPYPHTRKGHVVVMEISCSNMVSDHLNTHFSEMHFTQPENHSTVDNSIVSVWRGAQNILLHLEAIRHRLQTLSMHPFQTLGNFFKADLERKESPHHNPIIELKKNLKNQDGMIGCLQSEFDFSFA